MKVNSPSNKTMKPKGDSTKKKSNAKISNKKKES